MNRKQRIDSWFRGWFPQEPSYTSTVSAQINQKANHRRITTYVTLFVWVFATVFLSTAAAYGLGLGNIAGAVAATVGIVIAIAVNLKFNAPNQKIFLTEEGRKTAWIIGWANAGMLYLFLGTYFIVNPNIENAELTLGLWIVLLFSMFAVNSLLVRRIKRQMAPLEGM
jgi:membrane protease YdiL (CAAX protease family)